MFTHLVTLSVGTKDGDEWHQTYQELSELAANLGAVHNYVTVSSAMVDDDTEIVETEDELYHDENTLVKVREALLSVKSDLSDHDIIDMISAMQNVGILFRERR